MAQGARTASPGPRMRGKGAETLAQGDVAQGARTASGAQAGEAQDQALWAGQGRTGVLAQDARERR